MKLAHEAAEHEAVPPGREFGADRVLHFVIDAANGRLGDVQVGVEHATDDLRRRITLHERTQRRDAREAIVDDALETQRADRILDLDVVVVHRHLEVGDPARAIHEAERLRVRLFGLEVRVARGHRRDGVGAGGRRRTEERAAGRQHRIRIDGRRRCPDCRSARRTWAHARRATACRAGVDLRTPGNPGRSCTTRPTPWTNTASCVPRGRS